MKSDFTLTLMVDEMPAEVFDAVLNVREWWTGFYAEEIDGKTDRLDEEFSFRAGEGAHFSRQKLVERIPGKRVVWMVTDSRLTFVNKENEWNGTRIIFDISRVGEKTCVRFTHEGLSPRFECYESCSSAWTQYLQEKLMALIASKSIRLNQ